MRRGWRPLTGWSSPASHAGALPWLVEVWAKVIRSTEKLIKFDQQCAEFRCCNF